MKKSFVPPEEGVDLDTFKKALAKRRAAQSQILSKGPAESASDVPVQASMVSAADSVVSGPGGAAANNSQVSGNDGAVVDAHARRAAAKEQRRKERQAQRQQMLADLGQERAAKHQEKQQLAEMLEQQSKELENLREKLREVEEEKHVLVSQLKQVTRWYHTPYPCSPWLSGCEGGGTPLLVPGALDHKRWLGRN